MATRTEELLAQAIEELRNGRHYGDTVEGEVFSQTTTPLGLALPIYTATALGGGGLPLWNPPNSGVNVELVKVSIGRASGTSDFGAIGLMARKLDAIVTGAIMTALAETVPINGRVLYGGKATKTRSSNAGTNTVTAGAAADFVRMLFSASAEADATTTAVHKEEYDFDGLVVVPPGVLVYLAMTKASSALYATTLVWKERPL